VQDVNRITTAALLTLALSSGAAWAQTERSGGGVNAQLAQQYQQALAAKTQLEADNQKLKKQLDDTKDLKKQLDAANKALAA
jgi:hypothetical protein